MAELKTNLNEVSKKMDRFVKTLTVDGLKQAIHLAMQYIGFSAVADHMIQTTFAEAVEFPTDPVKLTTRTGNLAGSLVSAPRFSRAELPTSIEMMYGSGKGITIEKKRGIKESIQKITVSGTTITGTKGTSVSYAEKHEFGKGIRPRPFLNPALKESESTVMDIMEQTIRHQGRMNDL